MIPRPLFSGSHRGLALIAQTKVPGESFAKLTSATAECPVAARALDAIHALTVSSAQGASGSQHAQAIQELLRKFQETYLPESELWQAAQDALQQLRAIERVPTVFLHGDPEPQNLIVGVNGDIALIDWENAEIEGPPLWDHFSFLISYARFSLERSGVRPTSAAVAHRLFLSSSWSDWVMRSTRTLTERLQMPETAIEPLLILHAAVMSVRELWRLPVGRLGKGVWIRWMGELVRCRDRTPVLAAWRRGAKGSFSPDHS
jgi:aminoglycoside phosphotransferase (APT) family kinase protein